MPAGPGSTWAARCNGVAAGRGVPRSLNVTRSTKSSSVSVSIFSVIMSTCGVLTLHLSLVQPPVLSLFPPLSTKHKKPFKGGKRSLVLHFLESFFLFFFEALNVAGYCSWWKLNKVCVVMPSASWEHGPVVTHQGASYLLWTFERQYSNVFEKQLAYIRYSQNQSIALNFKYINAFQYLPAAFVYAIWKQPVCVQVEKVDSSVFYCDWYYCDWSTLTPSLNFHLLKLFNRIICLMQNRWYVF